MDYTKTINNTITHYTTKTNFSYTTSEKITSVCGYTFTHLLLDLQYQNSGVQTYHHFVFNQTGEPLFPTELELQITDHLTGEILYEFFGFNNPKIRPIISELINSKKPVDIYYNPHTSSGETLKQLKKFGHTSVHQLKSGKWVGEW